MAKRLYNEDDVRRLAPGSELVLGPESLATPSALDLARERGIRVRWMEAGEQSARSHPLAGLAEALGGDGSYHLEVVGGRVRAWRMGPEGPVEVPLEQLGG